MRKRTITEVLLEECPNCGASRRGYEEVCTYCGTSMVQRRRVFEEVEENPKRDDRRNDNRKVDIISEVKPYEGTKGLIGGVWFLIVWCMIVFGCGIVGIIMGESIVFVIVPFLMGTFGVAAMWGLISPWLRARRVMKEGQEYSAEVIGYGRRTAESSNASSSGKGSGEMVTIKVLAKINGREKCILLNAPDSVSELSHPIGCKIKIVGYGKEFLMKTDR